MNTDERRFVTKALSAFICVHLWLTPLVFRLLAQNAEVSGLITDPSGLAVPDTKVVVQSADTGAIHTVSSNQQGEYSVPALPLGLYNIMVEANGFKTVHQNGVVVEVDQRARLDFALDRSAATRKVSRCRRARRCSTPQMRR